MLVRQGFGTITAAEGLALLREALSRSDAQLAVLPLNVAVARKAFTDDTVPSMLKELIGFVPASGRDHQRSAGAALVTRLQRLSTAERLPALQSALQAEAAKVLALSSSDDVPLDRPLSELGAVAGQPFALMGHSSGGIMAMYADGQMAAGLRHRTRVFDRETAERLVGLLQDGLRRGIEDPETGYPKPGACPLCRARCNPRSPASVNGSATTGEPTRGGP